MTEAKTLSDQDRKALMEMSLPSVVMEVEKGHIRRFAEAIGDPNPLWVDESAGGIVASVFSGSLCDSGIFIGMSGLLPCHPFRA